MTTRLSTRLLVAQSDQRLVELSRQGYERAFEVLIKRYRKPLLRYCARMGLAPARSEDVVQQALLQAWLAVQRGVEVRELRAWLYRITHNTAVNAMRRAQADYPLSDAVGVGAAAMAEPEQLLAMRAVLGEVAELPDMQREAIVLSAIDGRSHEEVASTLGISEGAVRGLLYRARATLRAAVAAVTPAPLVAWAAGYARNAPAAAGAAGLPELTAAGGAAGGVGVLLKGAVIAVSTAALVAGAAVKLHGSGGHNSASHVPAAPAPSETEAGSPAAIQTRELAPAGASARGPASGGTVLPRRGGPAPGEAVARLGPSRSSFTSTGGPRPIVTHKPSAGGETPEWTPVAASTPPATVKAAAVQTPAAGSGGQTPSTGTTPPTTSPPPTTAPTPTGTEGTPPPMEKTDDHETTEKPTVGGEPTEKEPGDGEPSVKKEPLPGETTSVPKDD